MHCPFYLGQFLLNGDYSFGAVRTEAGEHRVDVGVHLEERLDHLAHRRGAWVLREDFASLFELFHLVTHDNQYRALA